MSEFKFDYDANVIVVTSEGEVIEAYGPNALQAAMRSLGNGFAIAPDQAVEREGAMLLIKGERAPRAPRRLSAAQLRVLPGAIAFLRSFWDAESRKPVYERTIYE